MNADPCGSGSTVLEKNAFFQFIIYLLEGQLSLLMLSIETRQRLLVMMMGGCGEIEPPLRPFLWMESGPLPPAPRQLEVTALLLTRCLLLALSADVVGKTGWLRLDVDAVVNKVVAVVGRRVGRSMNPTASDKKTNTTYLNAEKVPNLVTFASFSTTTGIKLRRVRLHRSMFNKVFT